MTRSRRVAALNPKMGITPMGSVDQATFESFPLSEKERVIMDICTKCKRAGEQVVIATLFVECNVRLLAVCEKFGLVADRFDGKVTNETLVDMLWFMFPSDLLCLSVSLCHVDSLAPTNAHVSPADFTEATSRRD